mgnify:CR=1 FL=1
MNLPKDYQSKMQEMLGEEYLQYLDSFNYSYGQTLRVNQLKKEPADFIRRFLLSGQVSWCNTGFYYEGEQKLSAHPYYFMQESIICRSRVRWHQQRFYQ